MKEKYDTSILPSNSHIKTVSGGAGGGDIKATISADAPSGVYYMQMTSPYNNGIIDLFIGIRQVLEHGIVTDGHIPDFQPVH